MTFKDDMVNQSVERLGALVRRLQEVEAMRESVKREIAEVKGVLKVLGAEDRIPVSVTAKRMKTGEPAHSPAAEPPREYDPDGADEEGKIAVEVFGQRRRVPKATLDAVLAMEGEFRVAAIKRWDGGYYALAHLVQTGRAQKTSHNKFVIVRPGAKPMNPEDDHDTEPGNLRLVDGVVTTEERPERGYGR